MRIEILKNGDNVLNVTREFIAVKRKCGEVDIIPIVMDATGVRIDTENKVTIGYGEDIVETQIGNVTITNF